jgi:hypothetical protein
MHWLFFSGSNLLATQCSDLLQSAEQTVVQVELPTSLYDVTQQIIEHKPDRVVCIPAPSENEHGETKFGVNVRAHLLAPMFIAQAISITSKLSRLISVLCITVRINEDSLDEDSSADVVKSVTDELIDMYPNVIK